MNENKTYHVIIIQAIHTDGEQFIGYLLNFEKKLYTADISIAQLYPCEKCANAMVEQLSKELEESDNVRSYFVTTMKVNADDLKLVYNASI